MVLVGWEWFSTRHHKRGPKGYTMKYRIAILNIFTNQWAVFNERNEIMVRCHNYATAKHYQSLYNQMPNMFASETEKREMQAALDDIAETSRRAAEGGYSHIEIA